jgi:hypothetical protein
VYKIKNKLMSRTDTKIISVIMSFVGERVALPGGILKVEQFCVVFRVRVKITDSLHKSGDIIGK